MIFFLFYFFFLSPQASLTSWAGILSMFKWKKEIAGKFNLLSRVLCEYLKVSLPKDNYLSSSNLFTLNAFHLWTSIRTKLVSSGLVVLEKFQQIFYRQHFNWSNGVAEHNSSRKSTCSAPHTQRQMMVSCQDFGVPSLTLIFFMKSTHGWEFFSPRAQGK